jgi:uncharacterized protein GlcG (DUF336 family)
MSDLTYEQARSVIDAALARARELGSPSSVAVVDGGRELLAFARQNGALLASAQISQAKAYTSRSLNMATKDIGALTQPGQPLYGLETAHRAGPFITFGGGRPIEIGGVVVGAIGVAGGSPDDDDAVAAAGAAAVGS